MAREHNFDPPAFAPIFADAQIALDSVHAIDPALFAESGGSMVRGKGSVFLGPIGTGLDISAATRMYKQHADSALAEDGAVFFVFKTPRSDIELARWRNQFWPWLHVVAVYRLSKGAIDRETLQGSTRVAGSVPVDGFVLVGRRREHAMSPKLTTQKFDANAGGWNGEPGKPGYAHFRWMRRFVARFARVPDGARVLDFGCGAGWVGIEAALSAKNVELCAFDPSPEMVKLAEENARANGIARFTARVGFGEAPPFPHAGEALFDCVFSSGVVSFSPDVETWCDGLVSTVKPGGTLVIGDIQRESRGMQKRRTQRVLLPARELNAQTADEMKKRLEKRGLVFEALAGYQLSDPIPQLTHRSDRILSGALSPVLLALNRMAAGSKLAPKQFDSWVMRLRRMK